METLRAEAAGRWDESPADEYLRVCREITMLQAHAAELLGRVDEDGSHQEAGYLSLAAFVRDRAGVSATEASRRVGEARGLRRHPQIREAYAAAELDRPRVAMLLAASAVSDEFFARDERMLVDTVSGLPMKDAYRAIDYWKQAADERAAEGDAGHLFERRSLHVSETLSGMTYMDAGWDPEGGQIVITALRSVTDSQQLDSDDDRRPEQRRADAMTEICGFYLQHMETPFTGGTRPQVLTIVNLEALTRQGGAICEFDDGPVITPETARRIACDASVSRVITRGESEVLDVGRSTRTIPAATRKALIVRDRHCRFAGCDRPHRWCDAHHLEHWADGGLTNLDNLVLLCRRHHRAVHEGGVDLPRRE